MSRIALCELVEDEVLLNEEGIRPEELTEDEIIDGEQELQEKQEEIAVGSFETQQALESLESIYIEREKLLAMETISTEAFNDFKVKIGGLSSVLGIQAERLFPSMENISDTRIAVEETKEQIGGILNSIGKNIASLITSTVDQAKYQISFYHSKNRAIDALIESLRAADKNKIVKITGKATNAFCYGEDGKVVENGKEYMTLSKDSTQTLIKLSQGVAEFVRSDFLNNLKVTFTFLSNSRYKKQFVRLEDLANTMRKLPGVQVSKTEDDGIFAFSSDVKLGMYRVRGNFPSSDSYTDDPNTMKSVAHAFSLRVDRVSAKKTGESVNFEMKVSDIIELLELSKELNKNLIIFNTAANKLSSFGSFWHGSGFVANVMAGNLTIFWPLIFANFRIMYKLMFNIAYLNGTTYNVTNTQLKKIMSIGAEAKQQLIA